LRCGAVVFLAPGISAAEWKAAIASLLPESEPWWSWQHLKRQAGENATTGDTRLGVTPLWVQALSAIAQVILTAGLVLATWKYVSLTKELADSARETSRQAQLPVLVLREGLGPTYGEMGEVTIVNIGSGPALDVKISSNATFGGSVVENHLTGFDLERPLEPWPSDRLLDLAPVPTVVGSGTANAHVLLTRPQRSDVRTILADDAAKIVISYSDVFGRRCETRLTACKQKFDLPTAAIKHAARSTPQ